MGCRETKGGIGEGAVLVSLDPRTPWKIGLDAQVPSLVSLFEEMRTEYLVAIP